MKTKVTFAALFLYLVLATQKGFGSFLDRGTHKVESPEFLSMLESELTKIEEKIEKKEKKTEQ